MPREYTFPLFWINVGVALPSVATPPATENVKSPTSRSPLPANPVPLSERLLKTASEKVTVIVSFVAESDVPDITGKTFSYKFTVLLL